MDLIFFPDTHPFDPDKSEAKDEDGDVGKEIKKLSKHTRDLYSRVRRFLKTLKKMTDIKPYLQSEQISKITQKYDGLYEMRIPKQRKGGVFRIYFCFSKTNRQKLILLCAELKHDTKPMKLDNALIKLKQYREDENKEVHNEEH